MSDQQQPHQWSDPQAPPPPPGSWSDPQAAQPQQPSWSQPPPANPWQSPTPAEPPTAPFSPGQPYPAGAPVTPGYGTGYPAQYSTPAYSTPYAVYPTRPTNSLAIAALVCSLVGIITLVSAPAGAIMGHIARRQIRERGEEGDGMALAGIIVGWIVTGLWACVCVGYIALFAAAFGTAGTNF